MLADALYCLFFFFFSFLAVEWESRPVRRAEARTDHFSLVLPLCTREHAQLDRGLAPLRLWRVGHPHICVERQEAHEEHSDQERYPWGRQCRALGVRRKL